MTVTILRVTIECGEYLENLNLKNTQRDFVNKCLGNMIKQQENMIEDGNPPKRNSEVNVMENLLLCLPAHFLDGGVRRRIRLEEGDTPELKVD